MQCLGRMCVKECILLLIVENLLLHDGVERISMELLPLLLYTVDIYIYICLPYVVSIDFWQYKVEIKFETFPCE